MPCLSCNSNNVTTKQVGPHIGEYCAGCGKHIRWVPQGTDNFKWPIGAKHKGKTLKQIYDTDKNYLVWAAENVTAPNLKRKAQEALKLYGGISATPGSIVTKPVSHTRSAADDELPPWDV
jgi:hypothetical protein